MTSLIDRSLTKLHGDGWTAKAVDKRISYRDAKLDAKLWGLVDELLGRDELATADPKNLEKWSRQADAIQSIRELRTLYKPPVMPGIHKDLYGFGDILAFRHESIAGTVKTERGIPIFGDILIVQATSFANLNSRIAKATVIPEFAGWLNAGGLVEFHGWRVRKSKRGDGSTCKVVRFPEGG